VAIIKGTTCAVMTFGISQNQARDCRTANDVIGTAIQRRVVATDTPIEPGWRAQRRRPPEGGCAHRRKRNATVHAARNGVNSVELLRTLFTQYLRPIGGDQPDQGKDPLSRKTARYPAIPTALAAISIAKSEMLGWHGSGCDMTNGSWHRSRPRRREPTLARSLLFGKKLGLGVGRWRGKLGIR
jgi:hypothetical protein